MELEPGKWAKLKYDVQLREKQPDGKWLVDEFACNEAGEHVACASSIVDEKDLTSVKDISPWEKKAEDEAEDEAEKEAKHKTHEHHKKHATHHKDS